MNPQQLKMLIALALCSGLAVVLGYLLGTGNYNPIFMLLYGALGVFVLVAPGYAPLIALGLVCPFTPQIPFVYGFPFFLVILTVCAMKYAVRQWMSHQHRQVSHPSLSLGFGLFFGWVLIRYCIDPIVPNMIGFGVTAT